MTNRKRKQPLGQTIGGVLFGFEQQVLRTAPPAQELVHHARPDDPVPAGDGSLLTITMPIDAEPASDAKRQPAHDSDADPARHSDAQRATVPSRPRDRQP